MTLEGAASGPLAGLRFVAKDVFDVAGQRTGAGSPDWLRTHAAATATAPGGRAAARGRRAPDREIRDRRARLQPDGPERALRHADQSARARPAARADPRADRRPPSPAGLSSSRSAPTAAARCGCRRATAASSGSVRATGASRSPASCRWRRASTRSAGSRASRRFWRRVGEALLGEPAGDDPADAPHHRDRPVRGPAAVGVGGAFRRGSRGGWRLRP